MTRPDNDEADDPLTGQFLGFLARDMTDHPERLRSVDADLLCRIQSLVGTVEVDLDALLTFPEDGKVTLLRGSADGSPGADDRHRDRADTPGGD